MRSEPNRSTFFWKEIELQEEFLKFEETVQIYIPSVSRNTTASEETPTESDAEAWHKQELD